MAAEQHIEIFHSFFGSASSLCASQITAVDHPDLTKVGATEPWSSVWIFSRKFAHVFLLCSCFYSRSLPRIRLANCISLGMMVTRLPWNAHRFASSNNPTRCASAASCKARMAVPCQRKWIVFLNPIWISRTSRANGSRLSKRSVLCWYLRISFRARSPKSKYSKGTKGSEKTRYVSVSTCERWNISLIDEDTTRLRQEGLCKSMDFFSPSHLVLIFVFVSLEHGVWRQPVKENFQQRYRWRRTAFLCPPIVAIVPTLSIDGFQNVEVSVTAFACSVP